MADSTPEQRAEAERKSSEAHRAFAERAFSELLWTTPWLISWIAYRKPEAVGKISSRQAMQARKLWPDLGGEMAYPNPEKLLRRALQDGTIHARKNGKDLPIGDWDHGNIWADPHVQYRRADALSIWPPDAPQAEPDIQTAPTSPPARPRRGPTPGAIDRFGSSDRALFPEIKRLMARGSTLHGATLALAEKIEGAGADESRAKRLARKFQKEGRRS